MAGTQMKLHLGWLGLVLGVGLMGGWALSKMSEQDAPATQDPAAVETSENPLATLDWLVGDWEAETPMGVAEFSCKFTKNDAFLVRTFRAPNPRQENAEGTEGADASISGMQVVAWDSANEMLRSWTFDSTGGFGEDVWSQNGDTYTLRTAYTLPDGGRASSLNAMSYIDDNTFSWRATNREIDGELLQDSDELTFHRMQEPAATEPN
jgi:hypothetical protein